MMTRARLVKSTCRSLIGKLDEVIEACQDQSVEEAEELLKTFVEQDIPDYLDLLEETP